MKRGWGCGAERTGPQMRAHFTICPNRGRLDHVNRRGRNSKAKRDARLAGECSAAGVAGVVGRFRRHGLTRGELKVKRGHPRGPRTEMRLGLRRPAYRAQYARAPHSMPEAAGSLRNGPTGGSLKIKRGHRAANAIWLTLRPAQGESEAGTFHPAVLPRQG
jgi:hypothetical protein